MKKGLMFFSIIIFIVSCSVTQTKVSGNQREVYQDNNFTLSEANIELIERSLNILDLKEYLHLELSDRLPLRLEYDALNSSSENYIIDCFGHPVKIVNSANDENEGSKIDLAYAYQDSKKTDLIFRYSIEGIKLTVLYEFNADSKSWNMVSKKIVEY